MEYPAQLDKAILEVKDWEPSTHRWGRTYYVYIAEESKKRRPTASKHSMKDNYNEAPKFCNNTILPLYYKKHGKDGTPPSGSNKEKLLEEMKKELGMGAEGDEPLAEEPHDQGPQSVDVAAAAAGAETADDGQNGGGAGQAV